MNAIFCKIRRSAQLVTIAAAVMLSGMAHAELIKVKILVSNVESAEGKLVARAYNDENWLSDNPTAETELVLTGKNTGKPIEMTIEVEAGEHAFSVYHDADNNGKMNTNFIGLPSEPVGLSNKHRPRFGPPRYKKARLNVSAESPAVAIRLD